FIGSAEMCAAYAWRAFFSHELWQIVTGSMLVTIGTSLAYAAMPVLLIGSVPAGETSSANGLNTLLRSIGTAGSSAAAAAITSAALLQVNGVAHPSFGGFMTVFAMAAGAAGAAAVVAAFRWWIRSAAPVDAAAATTSRPPEPALRAGPTRS
ncbi:MAG: MFS transporter, partial [Microbacterium sp.]|nr:MFS transporter [Microbacterium sp.]